MSALKKIRTFDAEVVRVVDGDTVWLNVDLGFRIHATVEFRLWGIDAPELVGESRDRGLASKHFLEDLLVHELGTPLPLSVTATKADKYGRWLAEVYVKTSNGPVVDVIEEMVKAGHAVYKEY